MLSIDARGGQGNKVVRSLSQNDGPESSQTRHTLAIAPSRVLHHDACSEHDW